MKRVRWGVDAGSVRETGDVGGVDMGSVRETGDVGGWMWDPFGKRVTWRVDAVSVRETGDVAGGQGICSRNG